MDAHLLKLFFGINEDLVKNSSVVDTSVESSLISSSVIGSGSVKKSVINNVHTKYLEAEGSILVNVTAKRIIAKPGSIVYNVIDNSDDSTIIAEAGQVLAGVFYNDGRYQLMKSSTSIDGGKNHLSCVRIFISLCDECCERLILLLVNSFL